MQKIADPLQYVQHYPEHIQLEISRLAEEKKLASYLLKKYPGSHEIRNNGDLYEYVKALKNRFMKKSKPLKKVAFDKKVSLVYEALGINSTSYRVHGGKVKVQNEINISPLFKKGPEDFLRMIVVHELAHFKEREHNKNFYQLCQNMEGNYHQLELDTRIYLIQLDLNGEIYK